MKKILAILSCFVISPLSTFFSTPVVVQQIRVQAVKQLENKTLIIFVFDGNENSIKEAIVNKDDIKKILKANIKINSFSFFQNGIEIKENFLSHQEYEVILNIEHHNSKQEKPEMGTVKFKIKIVFLTYPQKLDNVVTKLEKVNLKPKEIGATKTDIDPNKTQIDKNTHFNRLKVNFDPAKVIKQDISYVVLDFETANYERTSACQIAIALVKNSKIVENYSSLIKPYPLRFVKKFIKIHHIDYDTVKNAKTFAEIWNDIRHFFDYELVFAHNAAFDMSVLKSLVNHYQLECPNFTYGCTWRLLTKTYLYENYKLNNLASWNDIIFEHHDASEDVKATIELINLHFCDGYALYEIAKLSGYDFKKFLL